MRRQRGCWLVSRNWGNSSLMNTAAKQLASLWCHFLFFCFVLLILFRIFSPSFIFKCGVSHICTITLCSNTRVNCIPYLNRWIITLSLIRVCSADKMNYLFFHDIFLFLFFLFSFYFNNKIFKRTSWVGIQSEGNQRWWRVCWSGDIYEVWVNREQTSADIDLAPW